MNTKYEELYNYSVQFFGEPNIQREDFQGPEAIEIHIRLNNRLTTKISCVTLALYNSNPPNFYMQLDDFSFEYDDKEEVAIKDMKRYLSAVSQNKLAIKSKSFFGLKFNKKLIIE